MSFHCRFLMLTSLDKKSETMVGSVGRAARSMAIKAGLLDMLPSREIRRPI